MFSSSLPLHPAIVHLPLGLAFVMPLLAFVIWFGIHKNWFNKNTWLILILLQAIIVGGGILAQETGEDEEEKVEKIVSENLIEAHEEKAEVFVYWAGAAAVLAIAGFVLKNRWGKNVGLLYCLSTLGVLAGAYYTGHSGGELVYQHNAGAAYLNTANPNSIPEAKPSLIDGDEK